MIRRYVAAFGMIYNGTFPTGGQIFGGGGTYWKEWMQYSNKADSIVLSTNLPTLVMQGLNDENLPNEMLNKNIQTWQSIANQATQKIEFKMCANTTHMFFDFNTPNTSSIFIHDLVTWLKNH